MRCNVSYATRLRETPDGNGTQITLLQANAPFKVYERSPDNSGFTASWAGKPVEFSRVI